MRWRGPERRCVGAVRDAGARPGGGTRFQAQPADPTEGESRPRPITQRRALCQRTVGRGGAVLPEPHSSSGRQWPWLPALLRWGLRRGRGSHLRDDVAELRPKCAEGRVAPWARQVWGASSRLSPGRGRSLGQEVHTGAAHSPSPSTRKRRSRAGARPLRTSHSLLATSPWSSESPPGGGGHGTQRPSRPVRKQKGHGRRRATPLKTTPKKRVRSGQQAELGKALEKTENVLSSSSLPLSKTLVHSMVGKCIPNVIYKCGPLAASEFLIPVGYPGIYGRKIRAGSFLHSAHRN